MYGNYGYGGYGGGMGMMGGQETMLIALCCVCCICLCVVVGLWASNAGCSAGFGRSCPAKTNPPTVIQPQPSDDDGRPSMDICTEEWGKQVRAPNDPRPPIRPEYCKTATRAIGRDCYYWEVQADPVTGMARWMRKTDDDKGDMRSGGTCTPEVQCKNVIDPATLGRYTDLEPEDLLKQCTAVAGTATNEADTIKMLTEQAKAVGGTWTGTLAWSAAHSKIWYDQVLPYIGQKDLNAYIANAVKATQTVKDRFASTTMLKSTFAYILEAAVRSPENRADWIIDIVNQYNNITLKPRDMNEKYFVSYLKRVMAPHGKMVNWENVIDNPRRIV